MELNDFWAKSSEYKDDKLVRPYVPVILHLLDAANVAYELLNDSTVSQVTENFCGLLSLDKSRVLNLVSYIVGMHDIGKLHPYFQGVDPEMEERLKEEGLTQEHQGYFRHEYYTRKLSKGYLSERVGVDEATLNGICEVLSKHHYKSNTSNSDEKGFLTQRRILIKWKQWQDEVESVLHEYYPISGLNLTKCSHLDSFCMQLLGVLVAADWVASSNFFSNSKKFIEFDYDIERYQDWSKKIAKASVRKLGLEKGKVLPKTLRFSDIDKNITDSSLRPIQKEVVDYFERVKGNEPKFMIIEAPMGEGKTEVALYAASRMGKGKRGLYFALPTAATSNQMYERISRLYKNLDLSDTHLLHAMSWLVLSKEDIDVGASRVEVSEWLTSTRTGMMGSSAVGTVDQSMLSVMQVRFGVLRLLGLIGKVLVIDEIHSYDAYMQSIIQTLLKWCSILKIPVILLSATLQESMRKKFVSSYTGKDLEYVIKDYPLITADTEQIPVTDTFIKGDVNIEKLYSYGDIDSMVDKLAPLKESDGCVAVIVNTVKGAQDLYNAVKNKYSSSGVEVLLFHAKFKAKRRKKLEILCKSKFGKGGNRPRKAILIATQVVEQSLDLDFDWLLTEICPIDLFLQRIGRLHRHRETYRPSWLKEPKVSVFMTGGSGWGILDKIYAPFILSRTEEVIDNINIVSLPSDIRPLVDRVYSDYATPNQQSNLEDYFEFLFEKQQNENMGKSVALPDPEKEDFCLSSSSFLNVNEDDSNSAAMCIATTRNGLPTRLCAFLNNEELESIGYLDFEKLPTKEQAERVLENSLSLYTYNLGLNPKIGYEEPKEGVGLLKGCLIYKTIGNRMEFHVDEPVEGYIVSNEYGIIVNKKKTKK